MWIALQWGQSTPLCYYSRDHSSDLKLYADLNQGWMDGQYIWLGPPFFPLDLDPTRSPVSATYMRATPLVFERKTHLWSFLYLFSAGEDHLNSHQGRWVVEVPKVKKWVLPIILSRLWFSAFYDFCKCSHWTWFGLLLHCPFYYVYCKL